MLATEDWRSTEGLYFEFLIGRLGARTDYADYGNLFFLKIGGLGIRRLGARADSVDGLLSQMNTGGHCGLKKLERTGSFSFCRGGHRGTQRDCILDYRLQDCGLESG